MSHFAQVINEIVINVIVAEQDFIDNYADKNGQWIQTSYNTRGGVHYGSDGLPDGGPALRGNFAGIGWRYDATHDIFSLPSPGKNFTLNSVTGNWDPIVPMPQVIPPDNWVWIFMDDICEWVMRAKKTQWDDNRSNEDN